MTDQTTLTPEQVQRLYVDVEREMCKRDCSYFVSEYVKIEDRDKPNVVIRFSLWPSQIVVLLSFLTERLIQILKARQLGLTWLALAYATWCMVFKPGFSVIALSKTEEDAKELVRRTVFVLKHLPNWMCPHFEDTKESIVILHEHDEPSTFKSFPASEHAGRSFTASLLLLDEWAFQQWAREIWRAAFPSVNRPTGGQVIGLSTIERGTLFEELWLQINDFKKIFLPWTSDPRRDVKWYKATRQQLGELTMSEYPATVEEALAVPGGAFFSEFRSLVHIKPRRQEEIPSWFTRFRVLDYGLDMLACYWLYLDEEQYARVYRELHIPKLVISEAAYKILGASGATVPDTVSDWNLLTPAGKREIARTQIEDISATFAPPDLFSRSSQTGRASSEVWYDNGIDLRRTKNDFEQGCIAVAEWLKPITRQDIQTGEEYTTARLAIDEDCAPQLVKSFLNIQRDKNKPKVYGKQPHELTHAVDAIRYFCSEWLPPSLEPQQQVQTYTDFTDYINRRVETQIAERQNNSRRARA